jgi:hypothetical protein
MSVTGFAVSLDGEILIRTVSDTEQAAQVNGLAMCFSIMPEQHWPTEYIEALWLDMVGRVDVGHSVQVVPVVVEIAKCH